MFINLLSLVYIPRYENGIPWLNILFFNRSKLKQIGQATLCDTEWQVLYGPDSQQCGTNKKNPKKDSHKKILIIIKKNCQNTISSFRTSIISHTTICDLTWAQSGSGVQVAASGFTAKFLLECCTNFEHWVAVAHRASPATRYTKLKKVFFFNFNNGFGGIYLWPIKPL